MKFSTKYINKENADDNDDNGDNNNSNLIVLPCVEKVLVGFARIFSRLNSY
jgi:hypothetical protein